MDVKTLIKQIPRFTERKVEPPNWIIPGLIVESHFHMITGLPGGFKSTFCLWIAKIACALGYRVVYVDLENSDQLVKERFDWLKFTDDQNLIYWNDSLLIPDIIRPKPLLSDELYLPLAEPNTIMIFDSLTRFHLLDENVSKDMAQVTHFFARIKRRGATPLLIHHSGKPSEGRDTAIRGSIELEAAPDMAFVVTKRGTRNIPKINLRFKKNRWDFEGEENYYLDKISGNFIHADDWEPQVVLNTVRNAPTIGMEALTKILGEEANIPRKRARELLKALPHEISKDRGRIIFKVD